MTHQGYPSYFPVLLGTWKVLGAVALLVPRRPLLKEWAYAGAFFTYTGADRLPPDHRLRPRRGGLLAVLTALAALAGRPAAHLLLVQPAESQACSLFGEPPDHRRCPDPGGRAEAVTLAHRHPAFPTPGRLVASDYCPEELVS